MWLLVGCLLVIAAVLCSYCVISPAVKLPWLSEAGLSLISLSTLALGISILEHRDLGQLWQTATSPIVFTLGTIGGGLMALWGLWQRNHPGQPARSNQDRLK